MPTANSCSPSTYSFASRLDYWATSRLGEAPQPAKLVIAQLVASPLRNEFQSTRDRQDDGYTYHRHWYEGLAMPPNDPEGYAGYNQTTSESIVVGTRHQAGHVVQLTVDGGNPTVNWELGQDAEIITLGGSPPDYRYRLEYLDANEAGQRAPTPPAIGPVAGESPRDRLEAALAHAAAAAAARGLHGASVIAPEIVGINNLGEITSSGI